MAEILFPSTLFSGLSINGQVSSVPTVIDLRFCSRAEGLAVRVNKGGNTGGSIKVRYAISFDGRVVDGNYNGNSSIVTASREDFPSNPTGWNVSALPNFLTPFVFLKFSGATGNPATGVTVDAILIKREPL
jgi:hypothetical protein